jgi:hypothetical protein
VGVNTAQQTGHGNPRRKPENVCDGFGSQDGELVGRGGEVQGRQDEVDQDQERPDAGEEHELGFGWGPGVVARGGPIVDNCGGNVSSGLPERVSGSVVERLDRRSAAGDGTKGVVGRCEDRKWCREGSSTYRMPRDREPRVR